MIVVRDPEFDSLAAGGGTHVDMPFWQDLSGDREVLSDSGALTPAKLTAIQARKAFGLGGLTPECA